MSQSSGILLVSPRSLLSPDRLDLAVKWRFFRHLIDGEDPDSERVYRAHIMGRTGGVEPGGSKRRLDDYVDAARLLLSSMKSRGFDPAYPIPVGSNGRIRNGAHRIACALALGVDVAIERLDRLGTAAPWDDVWLRRGGLTATDIARAKSDLMRLHD
jgi:hypothetical protein